MRRRTGVSRTIALLSYGILAVAAVGCGQADQQSSETKIFGGNKVAKGAWLSTVAITDKYSGMYCSGTAISPYVVVTAGHCAGGFSASSVSVYVGEGKEGGSVKGQYPAEKIIASPKYKTSGGRGNDIAYIKLKTPIDLPEEAFVKVLTDKDEIKELLSVGSKAHLVGFGNRDGGGFGVKFEVDTQIVTRLSSLSHDSATEVAVGGNGKDSCQGDSGGPVFGQLKSGEWRVYGVTSRGGACGTGGIYGLIHANICWIQQDSGIDLKLPEGTCATTTPSNPGDDDATPPVSDNENNDGNWWPWAHN